MATFLARGAREAALLAALSFVWMSGTLAGDTQATVKEPPMEKQTGQDTRKLTLIKQARRSIDTPGVVTPPEWYGLPYEWQSEHHIVYWQGKRYEEKAIRIDTLSGERDDLKAFNARVRTKHGEEGFMPYEPLLSPDGNWMLSRERVKGSPPRRWRAISLDGKQEVKGNQFIEPCSAPIWGIWTQDSKGWVSLEGLLDGPEAEFCPRGNPKKMTTRKSIGVRMANAKAPDDGVGPLLGFSPDGWAVASRWHPYFEAKKGPVKVFEFDIKTGKSPPRVHSIRLPKGARADELVLSRQGDRLAWKFYFDRVASDAANTKPISTIELWVSKLNGSEMRRIGAQQVKRANNSIYEKDFPYGLCWTPDGKQLSFLYQQALYLISVD
jgi:hypothetical protein